MRLRVRAKETGEERVYSGYYNLVRRRPGDVFDLLDVPPDEKEEHPHFSPKWMEKVDNRTPKTSAPGEPREEDLKADGILPEPETLSEASKRNKKGRPHKVA